MRKIEQFKVKYETVGGSTSTAYLDHEVEGGEQPVFSGTDKHTDEPVTVRRISGTYTRYFELANDPVLEGRVLTPEEEAEVNDFAEMLDKPASVYVCPECKKEIPRGLENLIEHKKVGGECDLASKMIGPGGEEYEEALLTKRNMKEISKRSGKSVSELNIIRKTLLGMGSGMKIKYKVVKQ